MTRLRHPLATFVGRTDCFAVQQPNGAYTKQDRPLTDDDLLEHAEGLWSIGTYTITPKDGKYYVNHIVFDLDTYDKTLFHTLVECVTHMLDPLENDQPWLLIEDSGGKGYHLWVILSEPVEAWHVRAWLDAEFWPKWRKHSGNAVLEVFPKQDAISEGGYGNLVKLPFGIHAKTGNKSKAITLPRLNTAASPNMKAYHVSNIPEYVKPASVANHVPATAASPTGMLLKQGPVSDLLRGEVQVGERNRAFHAFFTWCAWNIRLPDKLAWEWALTLNDALPNPEEDEGEIHKTMVSAYSRPPADAATPRPTSGRTPRSASKYRTQPLHKRLANLQKGQ